MSFTGKKKDHTILRFSIFNALSLWNVARIKKFPEHMTSGPSLLKSLVILVISLPFIGAIYSRIAQFFALNFIFFLADEDALLR